MYHDPHVTFLDGLKTVLDDGISAVTLSLEEIFLLANDSCALKHNLSYGDYMRFLKSLDEFGEPAERDANTKIFEAVRKYIKTEEVRQRRALLQKVQEGQKDWRRYVWLLQMRQREERLKLAQAKQQERERKERQKAAEAAAKQDAMLKQSLPDPKQSGAVTSLMPQEATATTPIPIPQDGSSTEHYGKVG